MEKPVILINLKTYELAVGKNISLFLTQLAKARSLPKARVIVAVPATDLIRVAGFPFEVYGQHVEPTGDGAYTGHLSCALLQQAGARGSLLNHAEHQISSEMVVQTIQKATQSNFEICLCANTPDIAAQFAVHQPLFLAIEPPDLIGGDKSVSQARPEVIQDAVKKIRKNHPNQQILVGAGIKTGKDLRIALDLGTQGVLLASGIVKAKDPAAALSELLSVL